MYISNREITLPHNLRSLRHVYAYALLVQHLYSVYLEFDMSNIRKSLDVEKAKNWLKKFYKAEDDYQ